ncbi:MAG: ATP-binding protein [Leptolyngbyaceae cyanobacterium MO_188.B28]|nr:ATP-binding protein [Leptolyngbyaceae cyanobacterium MO_188.B28]
MPDFLDSTSYWVLPLTTFVELRQLLAQKGANTHALLLTESGLATDPLLLPDNFTQFTLLTSPEVNVLILAKAMLAKGDSLPSSSEETFQVNLTLDWATIAEFLKHLKGGLKDDSATLAILKSMQRMLRSYTTSMHSIQGDFAQKLLSVMASATQRKSSQLDSPDVSNSSAATQLQQWGRERPLEQSLLLSQVITKIRQSLDLPIILETTVAQVRQFLQSDRLVIYQFDIDPISPIASTGEPAARNLQASIHAPTNETQEETATEVEQARHRNYITYESRISDDISSVLQFSEDYCFDKLPQCKAQYLRGKTVAIDDVAVAYRNSPCLLNFLKQAEVRAKLVAPIVAQEKLWGLLIAHQCSQPRHWQAWELEFLKHIAAHLAVAIDQSQLYGQLQHQKQALEEYVIGRTQELHDALLAAQSASRVKSEFLATMSHELRTPLTCIIGMSATLLRWSFGELSLRQKNYLNTIHESGERLLEVINDILEVSKIESGRVVLEISEFSLSRLARRSLETFRDQANQSGIELKLDLKVPLNKDRFPADPRRVTQILQNLLSNAVKFTPAGGKVNLRVRVEQRVAVLQVEDTGIGIPESQHNLLFQKFQQLEATRHRQYQGTGLGLALTKQLVDLHGGSISVTSKMGVGSVFTVRLPAQRLTSESGYSADEEIIPLEPSLRRILLVEDHEQTASIICELLTAADYQVIWIIDGSSVLEQAELLQPVAIIIDMALSGGEGSDIIQSLRRYVATAEVKILSLIAENTPQDQTICREAGADDTLSKPIVPEHLLHKISALMSASALE